MADDAPILSEDARLHSFEAKVPGADRGADDEPSPTGLERAIVLVESRGEVESREETVDRPFRMPIDKGPGE